MPNGASLPKMGVCLVRRRSGGLPSGLSTKDKESEVVQPYAKRPDGDIAKEPAPERGRNGSRHCTSFVCFRCHRRIRRQSIAIKSSRKPTHELRHDQGRRPDLLQGLGPKDGAGNRVLARLATQRR